MERPVLMHRPFCLEEVRWGKCRLCGYGRLRALGAARMAAADRHHGLVKRGDTARGRGLRSPLPPAPPAPREVPGAVAARRDGRHRAFGARRQTRAQQAKRRRRIWPVLL